MFNITGHLCLIVILDFPLLNSLHFVACYRPLQRVTVILKRLELYLNHCVHALQMLRSTVTVSAFELWKLGDFLCFKFINK